MLSWTPSAPGAEFYYDAHPSFDYMSVTYQYSKRVKDSIPLYIGSIPQKRKTQHLEVATNSAF